MDVSGCVLPNLDAGYFCAGLATADDSYRLSLEESGLRVELTPRLHARRNMTNIVVTPRIGDFLMPFSCMHSIGPAQS
jgi:hypothetical protein